MGLFNLLSKKKKLDDENAKATTHVDSFRVPPTYSNDLVVRRTAFALGQMERALRYTEEPTIRNRAESALIQLRNERATETLLECLKDNESGIRRGAAWALGMLGDPRAVEPLIQVMRDPDWEVQACAVKALGDIGDMRAKEPLTQMLKTRDEAVHKAVRRALEEMTRKDKAMRDRVVSQAEEILSTQRAQAEPNRQAEPIILLSPEKAVSQGQEKIETPEPARGKTEVPQVTTALAVVPQACVEAPEEPIDKVVSQTVDTISTQTELPAKEEPPEPAAVLAVVAPQVHEAIEAPWPACANTGQTLAASPSADAGVAQAEEARKPRAARSKKTAKRGAGKSKAKGEAAKTTRKQRKKT
jgi:HEAT repeats/PBS lyase HEAT-like repeat